MAHTARSRGGQEPISQDTTHGAHELAKLTPPKAHEHPEPQSPRTLSVPLGLGRLSRLCNNFNIEYLEEDAQQQVMLDCSWTNEEEDVLARYESRCSEKRT